MKKNVKFKEWLVLAFMSSDIEKMELRKLRKPYKVGEHRTPDNLNKMTIGQMLQLSEMKTGEDLFYLVTNVLLGMEKKETAESLAVEVVSFVGWVIGQVERINRLFDKAKGKPTDKEVRAGIEQLRFGMFGLVDWYAKRMGIQNHDEVMDVCWMRVYKCMDMDTKTQEFNRRLAEISIKQ